MKQKFPDITVAVDKDRCHGIEQLMADDRQLDVVLLDDAFQHRYVKPGINILLVDYHRLIIYDELLPAGRLREPLEGKERADIVIITKCPKDLKPMEYRVVSAAILHHHRLRQAATCLPPRTGGERTAGVGRCACPATDGHRFSRTGAARPPALRATPRYTDLCRPPRVQRQGRAAHQ